MFVRPNLPNPPPSRRKNLPKFIRFSLRLLAFPSFGAGDTDVDSTIPAIVGVPRRSTPSRAAFINAEPRVAGSNRPPDIALAAVASLRADVALLAVCDEVVNCKAVRKGDAAGKLALFGDLQCALNRSISELCSDFRIPFNSNNFLKFASDRSAM